MAINNTIQSGTNQGLIKPPSNLGQGGLLGNSGQMFSKPQSGQPLSPIGQSVAPKVQTVSQPLKATQQNTKPINPKTETKSIADTPLNQNDAQNKLAILTAQLSDLKSQSDAMKKHDVTDSSQLVKNADGQYVPVQPAPIAPGQPGSTQPYTTGAGLYGNIVTGLANRSLVNPADNQSVIDAQKNLEQLQAGYGQRAAEIGADRTNLTEQGGEQGLLTNKFLAAQGAAQGRVTQTQANAIQGQQMQQNALQQSGSLAQPQLNQYGQTYYSPVTGSADGGQFNPQDASNQYAQEVISGKRSYADAISAMGLYGNSGKQFLDQEIRKQNPQFDFSQAQTLGAQQGAIRPAYEFAKSALTNLQGVVNKLGVSQGTNVPIINAIGNMFSSATGIGSEATRQYQGAIAEARNAYAQLLAASKGGTPSEYTGQSNSAIPDNATPNDIQAAINNLESLGGAKVQIYGQPGGQSTGQTGSGLYSF